MYRELAHEGVIFGLRGGPYAGRPRTFMQAALPPYLIERLRGVVEGQGRPAPILKREGGRTALPLVAPAALAAVAAWSMVQAAAWGFGEAGALFQGVALAPLYAAGGVVLTLSSWLAWRARRALLPRRGVYLLPLDVVEVGQDSVTVTPLGDVRQVTIEGLRGVPMLVLLFEHGARHVFPVASEQDAERAHAALERSQETLEALSGSIDLEKALDLDPFFTLRGTGARGQEARLWELSTRSPARLAVGWALVAVVGVAFGMGLWKFRNMASDQALFRQALAADSVAAYEGYLAVGQLRRREATSGLVRARLRGQLAADNQRFHEQELRSAVATPDEAARDACEPAVRPDATVDQALACYRRRAPAKHPEVVAWVEQRARQGQAITVGFRHHGRVAPPARAAGAPLPCGRATARLDPLLCGREEAVLTALRQALSEVFPEGVLALRAGSDLDADLRVETTVTPGKGEGEATYAFDVRLATGAKPTTFRLTLPPPDAPLTAPRVRSLYTIDASAGRPSREAQLLSARAFDRLYDEVFGLFFGGDPRVPLR